MIKEEWLFPNAIIPVDVETTAALVAEIKRLIDVVGGMALAQPEQEPVVWMMPDGQIVNKWALQFYGGQVGKPLYTSPPQRTWVSLTDEEVGDLSDFAYAHDEEFVRNVEKYLKEKNNG